MPLRIHRAGHRYRSAPEPGIATAHAFSFSGHYDPANTSFGALLACNEESLDAGAGFGPHKHRDTEILTWVLEGALQHADGGGAGQGHRSLVRPGQLQYLSAGGGVSHSEGTVEGGAEPVRFLQFWLQPGSFGTEPAYVLADPVDPEAEHVLLTPPGLLRREDATLHLLRAQPYGPLPELPPAAYVYAHLARGGVGFRERGGPRGRGRELAAGDALRITEGDAPVDLTAGPDGAELLVWAMESPVSYG
ncbi:pirin family protein [Streptacidiphilus fuscans]|uniref:Pirin family protein n=1 Tax=Streptacidiphilus fuscans TaxID=2789292 RepID=A0A931FFT6_9ACTN|nr:pirin family protein [Streptacidiphilus fuscans]MBF9073202.1 pirin family protein [Streptacidiphilus fuscans]